MTARVTIGIPCFNAERWIAAAVQSALDQSWPEKEVIVVDDGSTDGSLAALEKFGDKIQVIRADHRGGNHARNLALQHSTGEWLQFLDADDYLEPPKIAQQLTEAGSTAADVIYSPVHIETMTSSGSTRTLSEIDRGFDIYGQWLAWQIPQTGGCLWRKSALEAVGGWKEDQPCCQEHELYLRALQAGRLFVFAPTPHAVYRIWSDDTVCRKDPQLVIKVKTGLIDEMRAWLTARNQWTPQHRRIAGRACFEMARTLAKYDLTAATAYQTERQAHALLHLSGPAAPASYRLIYHLLGFPRAERLSRLLRSLSA
jgi:glycosyltransferase involved in cell wall biosynthesis